MFHRLAPLALLFFAGCNCGENPGADGGTDSGVDAGSFDAGTLSGRCEIELTEFLTGTGAASGKRITSPSELIAGPNAHGKVGDFLLENEKIRVVVQAEGRAFGPLPYGGTIIDADLAGAGPGNDQFGEVGLLYNFGRTLKPDQYELLSDGVDGGSVVVAISGVDTPNDYLSIRNKLSDSLGRVPYADPYVAMPLRITNYFVLNPGEQRVRFVTGFCSTDNRETASLAVGDLTDPGYVLEFFNPRACTNGFGFGGLCFSLDQMSWFGYQGNGVAYGYAPYRGGNPRVPEQQNATLSVAGITGTIVGANGLLGLGTWVQPATEPRDGELRIPPRGFGVLARDFWVARDLGAMSTLIESHRARLTGTVLGDFSGVVRTGATPVANARVVFEGPVDRAVFFTATDGTFSGSLPARAYQVSAWLEGRAPTAKQNVTLSPAPSTLSFNLDPTHRLTVNVREANGGPIPAKVTVLCSNGPCAVTHKALVLYTDVTKDPLPDQIAQVAWVGPSGTATFELPAGQYAVLVSRGPEYSVHPPAYPSIPGQAIDLRTTDATINAVLARVLDTTGWMSADFHVHAVNSPDSIVDNAKRALTFAGDGLDIIVSTDHDVITDFAPIIAQTGLSPFLASVIGEEVSPMEWGHYNFFPLTLDPTNRTNGGALDWAGGEGPTLSVGEIFSEGRRLGARTIQVNHARGSLGGFTALQLDTDTMATHMDPALLRMSPQTGATADDSKLISTNFDALELLNPGDDYLDGTATLARGKFNDWFTLLSRGFLVAGTGVSDTHYALLATGWRTWVDVGVDAPGQLDPVVLSSRLNAMRAITSNGPFVTARAYRVDGAGAIVTTPVGIGGTVPPDTRQLGVTVEVQVPDYLDITKVELYTHRTDDDGQCPLDPMSARARTTRVSCAGVTNSNWPAASISASQIISLTAGDRELVTTDGAQSFYRYRKQVNFKLPAPTTDNWLVAMVYGSKSLAPVLYPYPGGASSATPFAFTNPILIDADGNGYDHPPFARVRSRVQQAPAPIPLQPRGLTADEQLRRWGEAFGGQ